MLKTEQILNAKFTPISKGTYSAEEVDEFLRIVAQSYEQSQIEKNELIKKISILADKIESYRNDEEAIKLSLLDAHKMAESIGKSSREKAEALVAEAEKKASEIKADADFKAAQSINEAREQAKSIVDNAKTAVATLTERAQQETQRSIIAAQQKADEIVAEANKNGEEIIGNSKQAYLYYSSEFAKLKDEVAKYKTTVSALCNSQLGLLSSIPQVEFEVSVPAEDVLIAEEPYVAPVVEEEPEFEELIVDEAVEAENDSLAVEKPAEEAIEEAVIEEEAAEEIAETVEPESEEEAVEETVEKLEEESLDGNLDELLNFLNSADSEAVEIEGIASDLDDFLPDFSVENETTVSDEIPAIEEEIPELSEEVADVVDEETVEEAVEDSPASEEEVVPEIEEAEAMEIDGNDIIVDEDEDEDEEDDFHFDPNSLDNIVFDDNKEEESDEDITSLFDSLFND